MELTINGNKYRSVKLNAIQQFHVARRLAPAILTLGSTASELVKTLTALQSKGDAAEVDAFGMMVAAAGPLANVLGAMTDEDSDYVINACLRAVSREVSSGVGWQNVISSSGGVMFDDIELPVMLQLVVAVIRENLANFTNALGPRALNTETPVHN